MDWLTPYRVIRSLPSAAGRERYRQAWWFVVWKWLNGLPWEVNLNGRLSGTLRMRLSARDQIISRAVFTTGEWEPLELGFMRDRVKPGMTVFDIGANIGVHTLTLAECVGLSGKVHAFEPTAAYDRLVHNVQMNGFESRVVANRLAVGRSAGMMELVLVKPGFESYSSRGVPFDPKCSTGRRIEVPMMALDAYVEQHRIERIDFMKLDVEGSEADVLQGASELLKRHRVGCILLELNDICLRSSGSSSECVVRQMQSCGYGLFALQEQCQLGHPPSRLQDASLNIIALPRR